VLDLFDMILKGKQPTRCMNCPQYADGADPMAILRSGGNRTLGQGIKITPDAAEDPTVSPDERGIARYCLPDALAMRAG
jgi:DNA polymerase-3 subunit gamma/tau